MLGIYLSSHQHEGRPKGKPHAHRTLPPNRASCPGTVAVTGAAHFALAHARTPSLPPLSCRHLLDARASPPRARTAAAALASFVVGMTTYVRHIAGAVALVTAVANATIFTLAAIASAASFAVAVGAVAFAALIAIHAFRARHSAISVVFGVATVAASAFTAIRAAQMSIVSAAVAESATAVGIGAAVAAAASVCPHHSFAMATIAAIAAAARYVAAGTSKLIHCLTNGAFGLASHAWVAVCKALALCTVDALLASAASLARALEWWSNVLCMCSIRLACQRGSSAWRACVGASSAVLAGLAATLALAAITLTAVASAFAVSAVASHALFNLIVNPALRAITAMAAPRAATAASAADAIAWADEGRPCKGSPRGGARVASNGVRYSAKRRFSWGARIRQRRVEARGASLSSAALNPATTSAARSRVASAISTCCLVFACAADAVCVHAPAIAAQSTVLVTGIVTSVSRSISRLIRAYPLTAAIATAACPATMMAILSISLSAALSAAGLAVATVIMTVLNAAHALAKAKAPRTGAAIAAIGALAPCLVLSSATIPVSPDVARTAYALALAVFVSVSLAPSASFLTVTALIAFVDGCALTLAASVTCGRHISAACLSVIDVVTSPTCTCKNCQVRL